MTFSRVHDLDLVRRLLTQPGAWDAATDDSAPAIGDWTPNPHPAIWYVTASEREQIVTLYCLIPENAACWQIHASRTFGRGAAQAHRGIFPWAFAATGASRIVASIPATNRIAIRAAQRVGMVLYGINPRSMLKHGQLVHQFLLGISAD